MGAKRRSVIRSAVVATGALAAVLLPSGLALADGADLPTADRTSIMLPEHGLAGLAEKAGHLPAAVLIGGAVLMAAAGSGLVMRRRRQGHAEGRPAAVSGATAPASGAHTVRP